MSETGVFQLHATDATAETAPLVAVRADLPATHGTKADDELVAAALVVKPAM